MTSPVLLFLIERGQNLEPNKQELFLRLLEQIKWQHLPEEQELFTGAAIDKVEVHTASKTLGICDQSKASVALYNIFAL